MNMTKESKIIAARIIMVVSLIILGTLIGYGIGSMKWNKKVADEVMVQVESISTEKEAALDDWGILIMAMAKTESDFNFLARGSHGDLGLLQATEIWVEEVNRILGDQVYIHSDALDPEKTLEMFKVMQDKHNPDHDIARAINLHNPGGDSIGYSIKVRQNIEWVKRYERVRKMLIEY